jgi:predicted RecA/RadA family phage recombinase
MALTSYKSGDVVLWTNGTGSPVTSGDVVVVGSLGCGVATVAIASTATGNVAMTGVHKLTKYGTSNALTQGQKVYWDTTNGVMNINATGRYFLGYADVAASATATTAYVKLAPFAEDFSGVVGATSSATAITLTAATMAPMHTIIASAAGTQAVAIPAAADCAGYVFTLRKTGTAGAVTVTPADDTIASGATYTACDAQNDNATFAAIGTDWVLVRATLA